MSVNCSVTELSGWLDQNTQITTISILDEILLICKKPQVNSCWCSRLSSLTTWPGGINTNMKNLDSTPSRTRRRLSLNTNHITSHHLATLEQPAMKSQEGGSIHRALCVGVEITSSCLSAPFRWSAGGGNCTESWDEDLVNIPNYLISFLLIVEQHFKRTNTRKKIHNSLRLNP